MDAAPTETAAEKPASTPPPSAPEAKPEASAEAPKAQDAKPEQQTETKDEKRQSTVPHAALHEARAEIKELRATISELKARPSLTQEQQAALTKLQAAEQATQDAEPDFLADPKGYVDTKVAAALKKLEESDKQSKETREQIQQQQNLQSILQATAQAEQGFIKDHPDYTQALEHVRNVRKEQLQMFHPQATEQQIGQILAQEEITTAYQALASQRNPAELIYSLAKTFGYSAQAKGEGAPAANAGNGSEPKKADKDAARSMGSGGSADTAPEEPAGNSTPEFSAALRERFARKRA